MNLAVTWDDRYNTGNYIIDYQHQRLVRLINDLNEIRLHDELRPFLIDVVFDEVVSYTHYHFDTEEKFMAHTNYSSLHEHKLMHEEFKKKLAHFKAGLVTKQKSVDREFCLFLRDWLINHILVEDPKFITEMVAGHGMV